MLSCHAYKLRLLNVVKFGVASEHYDEHTVLSSVSCSSKSLSVRLLCEP